MKAKNFFIQMLKGGAIGVAMIIPGVSGGTLAVLLNVYDKLIDSIGNLRKDFVNSVKYLFPILLGAVIALVAAYFPLKYFLKVAPLPTVLLFAGLMLGSCPATVGDAKKNGFKKSDIVALAVPFLFVIGICFIPGMGDVDLGEQMAWYLYIFLVLVGVLASCALVVPGISGSMLLMLLGFYGPILDSFTAVFSSPLHYIAVIGLFAVGIVIGFFTIAKLMQFLLKKYTRTTYWAIVGFVLGSIPAIMIVFDYADSPIDALQISAGVVLFLVSAAATFLLCKVAENKNKTKEQSAVREDEQLPAKYRPLSAWSFFGYNILFCIPLVGIICLIVFALSDSNINRRNFARSFFCIYIIAAVILVIVLIAFGGAVVALGNQ